MTTSFAMLAPVPLSHIESGLALGSTSTPLAYGTMKWEFLHQLEEKRAGEDVPVLIYASHDGEDAGPSCVVKWFGWYVGYSKANPAGLHDDDGSARPPSTSSDGKFAAFWHIRDLRPLSFEKHTTIGKIATVKGGWRKDAPPRGPELVKLPLELVDEK